MGYSADRSYRVKQKYLAKMRDLFSQLRTYSQTHEWFLARRQESIFSEKEYRGLPHHAKDYIRGYQDATMHHIWHTELTWCMWVKPNDIQLKEGKLCTRQEIDALQNDGYSNIWTCLDMTKSYHCWRGRHDRRFSGE